MAEHQRRGRFFLRRSGLSWSSAAFVVVATVAGCGSDNSAPNVDRAEAKGKVSLASGAPLNGGLIYLVPKAEPAREASGTINNDGTFTILTDGRDGAVPGEYKVRIQPDQTKALSPAKKAFQPKYLDETTSGLTVSIKPDSENQLDIRLN